MEVMALREQALSSLIKKRTSNTINNTNNFSEQNLRQQKAQHNPVQDHHRPMLTIQPQHMTPQIFNNNRFGARPDFYNPPFHGYRPTGFQPINPPIIPIQPHMNANFHPPLYNPVLPLPINDNHMNNVPMEIPRFEPTPPARLSPRSAK